MGCLVGDFVGFIEGLANVGFGVGSGEGDLDGAAQVGGLVGDDGHDPVHLRLVISSI